MKIVIAPDKFKGSLSSIEVCSAIAEGILLADKNADISFFPMADGGDGFAEVLKYYTGTVTRHVSSVDSLGRVIGSTYELGQRNKEAIIELAACSGLAMLNQAERNPMLTSSYGTGLQVMDAVSKGIKKIILGVGGSATTDAGIGILSAMGFRFLDDNGNVLKPIGESLLKIRDISAPDILPDVQFEIACDVTNPLFGPNGAAFIFSPQKGASQEQVLLLDAGLRHFAQVIFDSTGKNISGFAGAGAAGGIAAGLTPFVNVTVTKGVNLVMHASDIENNIRDADMVITGEGKLDSQSFAGKTVSAVTSMCNRNHIPVAAFCGKLDLTESEWRTLGLHFVTVINDGSIPESESMANAYRLLAEQAAAYAPALQNLAIKKRN